MDDRRCVKSWTGCSCCSRGRVCVGTRRLLDVFVLGWFNSFAPVPNLSPVFFHNRFLAFPLPHRGVFFFHSLIHEILLILLYFVLWLMIFVCTWCSCWYVLISFHSGLLLLFFAHTCHLVGGIVFFHLVAHAHRPIPTHIAIVLRWHASLHTEMLVGGGWCWLDDVQRFPPRRK